MNKILSFFALSILLLAACSSNEIPEELLSDEGMISYLVVYPNESTMGSTDFMEKIEDTYGKQVSEVFDHGLILYQDNAQSRYPSLNIDQAPYYIFFDSEGVALETGDSDEAEVFLEDKFQQ
jgi:hypothetical protein